jgi:hypothetical protein
VPLWPNPLPDPVTLRSRPCNRHGWPTACPASKSRRGRRPQRPGNQSALARVVWSPPGNSPSRITGCRWLCRNHSQALELSRFAALTFPEIVLSRNTKRMCRCEETVEDESSLWKIEENEELTWANLNAVKL